MVSVIHRDIVQLVERWSPKPNVEGSSPSVPVADTEKQKCFSKYGLMIISAIKNFLIFFLLGGLLGINVYQEGLEMYREIISLIPMLKNILTPEVSFALLWIFLFISESYIVRVYSNIIVSKLMKRK